MDDDIENEINKIRWARWRKKENKEKEKSYCYWDQWNQWYQWNNWREWHNWYNWRDWHQWYQWNNWNQWNQWNNWSDVPEEPTEHWEMSNSQDFGVHGSMYETVSLGVFGDDKYYSLGKWWYPWRITGAAEGRYSDGDPSGLILRQRVKVEEYYNKQNLEFKIYIAENRVGAWPKTGSNPDYYQKFYKTIECALNEMASLFFPFVMATTNLAKALRSNSDSEEQATESVQVDWYWHDGLLKADTSHVYMWDAGATPNQTVGFWVHDCTAHSGYIYYCMAFECYIDAPSPPVGMSASDRRKYGTKEIPLSEFKEWAAERGLPSEMIEKVLEKGEPVYIARIVPGEVTVRRVKTFEIHTQINTNHDKTPSY